MLVILTNERVENCLIYFVQTKGRVAGIRLSALWKQLRLLTFSLKS